LKDTWFDGVYSELAELLTMRNQRLLDFIELSLHLPELKGIGCGDKKRISQPSLSLKTGYRGGKIKVIKTPNDTARESVFIVGVNILFTLCKD
jgi:hypothetical protein